MRGISLFSSAGIGETYFHEIGLDITTANEIDKHRAMLYKSIYSNTNMINGDISDKNTFNKIIDYNKNQKIDFLLASPPCQGLSVAGKNRDLKSMSLDMRNYLIYKVVEAINLLKPTFILIENVPSLLKLLLLYNGKLHQIQDILHLEFGDIYNIEAEIVEWVHAVQ